MKVNGDCILYINDLQLEIKILNDIKKSQDSNSKLIEKKIDEKRATLENCKKNLSLFSINSIEYRIYYKILQGKNPSQAVEEIVEENIQNNVKPTSTNCIWKNYYRKVKNILKNQVKIK